MDIVCNELLSRFTGWPKGLHSSGQDVWNVWKVAVSIHRFVQYSLTAPIHSSPLVQESDTYYPLILMRCICGSGWADRMWGRKGQVCFCITEAKHVEQTWCGGLESTQRPHADRTWPPRSWIKIWPNFTSKPGRNQSLGSRYQYIASHF